MGLKVFHIIFVTVSTLLALGFAAWAFRHYQAGRGAEYLATFIGSVCVGLGLGIYGFRFAKKIK